jgi:hypothetical protein
MPEEEEGLVDGEEVEDAEDVRVEVADVEVVTLDVAEDSEMTAVEEDEEVVEEEEEEEEEVVPSVEAPFSTVKISLTASWPAASIIWIS